MAGLTTCGMTSEPWRIQTVPATDTAHRSGLPAKVMPSDVFMFDEAMNSGKPPSEAPLVGGEWVKAVFEVMPYLDSQQLREALVILDRAILNTQRAKALERIAVGAQVGSVDPSMPQIGSAAELLRMQVWHEQRSLMAQLQSLRLATRAARNGGSTSPTPGVSTSGQTGLLGGDTTGLTGPAVSAVAHAHGRGICHQAVDNHHGGSMLPPRSCGHNVVQAMTLSMSLQLLSKEDPDTLFIVRRINKLGFKAARKLKQHFSAYGQVVRVLVAHSTVKQIGDPQQYQWRRRPSSLGFIHMAVAESVAQVLSVGSEHEVDGCLIRVQRFERQKGAMGSGEEEEEGEAEEGDGSEDKLSEQECNDWDRQHSALSGASTSTGSAPSTKGDLETMQA